MTFSVQWSGLDEMLANMAEHADNVTTAVRQIAEYFAPLLEAAAKQGAPWTDRSSNARQTLAGYVGDSPPEDPAYPDAGQYPSEELADEIVTLYLSHGMQYGRFLEMRWAGRYAIIWPTIEEHLPQINQMLREVFS